MKRALEYESQLAHNVDRAIANMRVPAHQHDLLDLDYESRAGDPDRAFLIVGLIASIRRVLVITMQAAKMTEEGHGSADTTSVFRNSMLELGLLGILVLVFVLSIYLLRRASLREKLVED